MNLTQFLFNFTSEIRTVKLGVFSFSPIAPVCGAVKLGGVYIPMVYTPKFTTSQGAKGAVGRLLSSLHNSPLHRQVRYDAEKRGIWCNFVSPFLWGNGEYYFPYRTVSGETGKQGEYIYPRYILPFHRFSTGAKGAVGSSS